MNPIRCCGDNAANLSKELRAMIGKPDPASRLSSSRLALRAGLFGLALMAAAPAAAGEAGATCALDSKASPSDLIAACSPIVDNPAASRRDRAAALAVRANARANNDGDITEALADLDHAIALDGNNGAAYRLRGDLIREAGGDLGKAEADLSMAIKLDPQDAEAYELRGVVHTNQHRLDRAIADYD
jgi:tetratricopeptide (TPR) repeat protein